MPAQNKITKAHSTAITIETRKLEKLIRDSVRSEISAQQSRTRATDTYVQRLLETDTKVTEFIQQAIMETTSAYRLSVNFFKISYISAFIVLLTGILLSGFSVEDNRVFVVASIFIFGSIIWIISLQNKNIVKQNRSLVTNLAKLSIIFAGYVRQTRQVDAFFEEFIGNTNKPSSETAEQLLNNLQDAMTEALNAISMISNDLDN